VRILMYHRIAKRHDAAAGNPSVISATPKTFERQMQHLARHHDVISAEQALAAWRTGNMLPRDATLLTFDDGYRDFAEIAWPILRRHGLPALLFVPTAFPGSGREFWWDRLSRAVATSALQTIRTPAGPLVLRGPAQRAATLVQLRKMLKAIPHAEAMEVVNETCARAGIGDGPGQVLNWDQLRELRDEGVAIGAHTRTHPALTQLSSADAGAEIEGSQTDLCRELGSTVPIFSFPFGDHNDAVVKLVADAGFELAVTCRHGNNHNGVTNPLRLQRLHIGARTSPVIFRLRLSRAGEFLDNWRMRGQM
jgi:peptidoglycan/xylan/chitin deacetylase (PgdA/CDA1 family)